MNPVYPGPRDSQAVCDRPGGEVVDNMAQGSTGQLARRHPLRYGPTDRRKGLRLFSFGLLASAPLLALSAHAQADDPPLVLASAWSLPGEDDAPAQPVAGPPDVIEPAQSADAAGQPERSTFKRDVSAAKLEMAALSAIVLVPRVYRRAQGSDPFHFGSEGWFGRDTYALGMDKFLHGWKTYVYTDVIQSVIARRTGDSRSAAITAGIFGLGLTTLAEIGDGFSETTGFAYEDQVAHVAGAALSVTRNIVPGLRDKLDFRLQLTPKFDGSLGNTRGRAANSKYFLALQLAGCPKLERSPLRFAELHLGYYARGFSQPERDRGDPLRRRIFVGVGFNLQQLFRKQPRSAPERWIKGALDYIQVPYTALHS